MLTLTPHVHTCVCVCVDLGALHSYAENMLAGGLSRAAAQAVCHPLNVAKTLLQAKGTDSVASLGELGGVLMRSPNTFTRGKRTVLARCCCCCCCV